MIAYHKRVHADVFCSDISSVMRTQQQPVTVMHPQSSCLWWLRRRQKRSPSRSPSPSLQRLSQPRLQQSQERPAAALRPGPPPKRGSHRSNLLLQSTKLKIGSYVVLAMLLISTVPGRSFLQRNEIAATTLAEEALDARVAAAREARTRRRPPPGVPRR